MSDEKMPGRGKLGWMQAEVGRGADEPPGIRQFALAAALSPRPPEVMFTEAQAATPQKGGDLRVGISWGSTSNTPRPPARFSTATWARST